jgi:hypothetical protein
VRTYPIVWHGPLAIQPGRKPGWARLFAAIYVYVERINMTLTEAKGWEFDLDSVPRLPVVFWLFKGRCGKHAAAVHDLLYHQRVPGVSRLQADLVMWDQMTQDGIKIRWRLPIFLGVRLGGWWAWHRVGARLAAMMPWRRA